jgi:hypothetical protein
MITRKLVAGLAGAAAIATIGIAAPSASANPAPGQAIVDTVVNDPRFDVLQALVTDPQVNLAGTVLGLSNVTVFAPADQAFRGLLVDLTNDARFFFANDATVASTLLAAAGPDAIRNIVLYHVAVGRDGNKWFSALDPAGTPQVTDNASFNQVRFFGINFLQDGDKTDLDPFTVSGRIDAGNGNGVFVIAGVLRPFDLKTAFPLD